MRLPRVLSLALLAARLLTASTPGCEDMAYENRNQTDYGPLKVNGLSGVTKDSQGVLIPGACIGLFTEPEHRLVSSTQTDSRGRFRLPVPASGEYRLVASVEGLCTANARIQVQPQSHRTKSLLIQMRPAGLDACSYIEAASNVTSSCEAWKARSDALSPELREMVHRYGLVRARDWIVSPALVKDCEVRLGIEGYFEAAVAGRTDRIDPRFLEVNRAVLFKVLQRAWPHVGDSPAVPSDGAFDSERWGILRYARLRPSEMATLLRPTLRKEGISAAFVVLFLDQPNKLLAPDLKAILQRDSSPATAGDRSATTQIYCLALLYSIQEAAGIEASLRRIASSPQTTPVEKAVAERLRTLVDRKQPVKWPDIEGLEFDQ